MNTLSADIQGIDGVNSLLGVICRIHYDAREQSALMTISALEDKPSAIGVNESVVNDQ
jgi:hypothetical protein